MAMSEDNERAGRKLIRGPSKTGWRANLEFENAAANAEKGRRATARLLVFGTMAFGE